jgi:hypothetical protein
MPCIWGRHDRSQAFLNVAILDDALIARLATAGDTGKPTSLPIFKALIDTGSQTTCISRDVALAIGINPLGKVPIRGVAGVSYHNYYLFKVGFPFGGSGNDGSVTSLHIASAPIEGVEMTVGGAFDVLLGMDIIGLGSLKVDGDGSFSFSF